MYTVVALSSFLFVFAGILSVVLGGELLTALSAVSYGLIDFLWHQCDYGGAETRCHFSKIYYMGLLGKLDSFFQHTLIVYTLTSILFSTKIFLMLSRSLITWTSFFLILSHKINGEQADLITTGMYLGLWIVSHILHQHPPRRLEWTALLFVSFALGYFMLQVTRIVRDETVQGICICVAHVSFSFGVVCAALCLRVTKTVKKKK